LIERLKDVDIDERQKRWYTASKEDGLGEKGEIPNISPDIQILLVIFKNQ